MNESVAVILGGYVNGYSIIRELSECGVENIWLFDYGRSLARKSNKIKGFSSIDTGSESLKLQLLKLRMQYSKIIIFPTNDHQLEDLHAIYKDIKDFCFVPFNFDNILQSLDKSVQYSYCEKYDIPYPKTQNIETIEDMVKIKAMMFPILIKPNKLYDSNTNIFRGLLIENEESLQVNKFFLENFIKKGIIFLASEFIPGDDTNMYSYNAYRSQSGNILNEWIGKKLTQYPDKFGMFSSASNEAPDLVKEQGRKLLEVMDLKGICEPEFKYDSRDQKYKLTEITLRSTMWHRLGFLSGVDINYTLYLDASGVCVERHPQDQNKVIHFVYMKHEIFNLIFRRNYWKNFKKNVFYKHIGFAVYDKTDLKPILFDLFDFLKGLVGQCLRVLKIKK